MFAKIKAGLTDLPVDTFILKVRYIINTIATSANFPNLPYPVAEIETDVNTLSVLQNQVIAGNRIHVRSRNVLVIAIRRKMSANAAHVNGLAMGNPEMLATSGFEFAKEPAPLSIPAVIGKVTCKMVQPTGSVKVSWGASKDRDFYVLQAKIGADGTWKDVGTTTKRTYTVKNLAVKEYVYFRLAAVNSAGMSMWSNESCIIVG